MKDKQFAKLVKFLQRLEQHKIWYRLSHHVEDAVSVEAYTPGEHWEVDFFVDGDVYVERYHSNGQIEEESVLEQLFAAGVSNEDAPAEQPLSADEAASGK